ncbi:MAG: DUF262 domain-containing protein [Candidatus Methylophosphatis roskildensis]
MAKTREAHDKLIREIFEGSYQFEIPDYQRPYAWTTEQAEELFNDLLRQGTQVIGRRWPTAIEHADDAFRGAARGDARCRRRHH